MGFAWFVVINTIFFLQVVGCSDYKDLEIQVSCVEANSSRLINGASYRAHPFQLHGQDCEDGICRTVVGSNRTVVFSNIRIVRVKLDEMEESLMLRQRRHVDPYRGKFTSFADSKTMRVQ